ncbi:BBC [Nesidiocoris tenuis]|uniref:BBC n=1 Tax=Nesidiocoris tenuis TaxID=355587 RepID=A0ABN7AIC1_9HEMI|nr:BBC [Nesidiocoris tenuis]
MANINLKQEVVESNTCEEREPDWSLFKCVACKVTLTASDKSYLLECLHPVCNACLSSFTDSTSSSSDEHPRQCPGCQVAYPNPTYIENKFVNDLLLTQDIPDDPEDVKCSNHSESIATDWCDTCQAFICETCVAAHKQLRPTKDHSIKPKLEFLETIKEKKPNRFIPCPEHPTELLTVFCASCNLMTCRDCQLAKHRAHDYAFLSEIANSTKESLQIIKNEIENFRYQVDAQMSEIVEVETMISQQKSRVLNQIKDIVLKLTDTIRKSGTDLMVKVDEICHNKSLEMSFKKEKLDASLRQIDHCSNFVRTVLELASDPVLVYSKEHIMNRLNHVKDSAAYIHSLNLGFFMELQTPNIDKFVRAISSFAKIKTEPPNPQAALPVNPKTEGGEPHADAGHVPTPNLHHPQAHQPLQLNNTDHFAVPNYLYDGVNQAMNAHYQQSQASAAAMRQLSQIQMGHGVRFSSNVPQAQNVIRIAPHQQVTSTSNMFKPNDMPIPRVSTSQLPISRLPIHPSRKMFSAPSMPQLTRQLAPAVQQNIRYVVCRNYNATRSPPPWAGAQQRSVVKQPQVRPTQSVVVQQQPAQGVSWHIPQTETTRPQQLPTSVASAKSPSDPSFKIILTKSKTPPTVPTPTSVSSSAPETPANQPPSRPPVAKALDTLCQASLDDVMRILSDLDKDDSSTANKRDSVVHSSTGSASNSQSGTPQPAPQQKTQGEWQKEDPNEDWCAVCMDGGELVCCDHCPKVFHINCHIPGLSGVPQEIWQCTLCRDVSALPYGGMKKHSSKGRLTLEEQRVCERILLELYCQYDCSLHFREPVPLDNADYHKIIRRPMCFDQVRKRLTLGKPTHFCSVREFIADIRLVFKNAFTFNAIGSQVYADGMTLEEFLETLLTKFLPLFAHTNLHDDLNSGGEEDEDPVVPPKKIKRVPD